MLVFCYATLFSLVFPILNCFNIKRPAPRYRVQGPLQGPLQNMREAGLKVDFTPTDAMPAGKVFFLSCLRRRLRAAVPQQHRDSTQQLVRTTKIMNNSQVRQATPVLLHTLNSNGFKSCGTSGCHTLRAGYYITFCSVTLLTIR